MTNYPQKSTSHAKSQAIKTPSLTPTLVSELASKICEDPEVKAFLLLILVYIGFLFTFVDTFLMHLFSPRLPEGFTAISTLLFLPPMATYCYASARGSRLMTKLMPGLSSPHFVKSIDTRSISLQPNFAYSGCPISVASR